MVPRTLFFLLQVCRWLLYSGADPRAVTSEGNTVVMWAAWAGSFDTTRLGKLVFENGRCAPTYLETIMF